MLMNITAPEALSENRYSSLQFSISPQAPPDWDDFVSQTTGCVFHGSAWGNTLQLGYKLPYLYASLRVGDQLVLGVAGLFFSF